MTINMFDLFTEADFRAAREAKLITVRDDGEGLSILNYSDAAMFTPGAWDNPAVRHCRGLIVDTKFNVIARPWAKFFNHGQIEAGELDMDAPVEVTDKLDGSLGIIHRGLNGGRRVASRGSFESDQAIHATEILLDRYPELRHLDRITPLVEITYPANRIVVDYGDFDDLVLLGGVIIKTGDYLSPGVTADAVQWHGPQTEVFDYRTLKDALEAAPRPGMEGFAVRYLGRNHIVKIKYEDYVRLHRIVTGLSERTVWQHMVDEKPLSDLLGPLPDELHTWTLEVWDRIDDIVSKTELLASAEFKRIMNELNTLDSWTRGDFAEKAKKCGPFTPFLFQLLDGRDIRPSILKGLKPAGDTRAKAVSEATA